jgi:hypothetical protein
MAWSMWINLPGCQCFACFGKLNSREMAVVFCPAASVFATERVFQTATPQVARF